MADPAGPLLKRLALPVYVPSMLSAAGGQALMPMLPLIAIQLGYSPAASALLISIIGLMAIVGPIPLGVMMERTGERPAMILAAVLVIASSLAGIAILDAGPSAATRSLLVLLLVVDGIAGEVWDLGRQTYLGAELPHHLRGRAMNFFGGMMRVGGVVGPSLGAGAYAIAGFQGSYALRIVLMATAAAMVLVFLVPSSGRRAVPTTAVTGTKGGLYGHVVRAILIVGVGLTGLIIARLNVSVLLPLVGQHIGLNPRDISLVFALGMALEIVLFLPAGVLLDRWGRAVMGGLCCLGLGVGFVLIALVDSLGAIVWGAVAWYVIARLVISFGNSLGSGIVKTLSVDLTPAFRRAAHMGLYNSITGAGVLLGPAVVAAVTAAAGVLVAAAATGGLTLAGGAWLFAVLPRYAPGWHGRQPDYQPDPILAERVPEES
ncbi:MFS transporter [Aestuariimicrobium kwangyangense]|uniref:MFS transporter n=1 Tax=Aestuariimicrobium kwangyangense TaxID=396389 RepID=UPI0003B531D0|nr:MFS transporter [Aestuariimicrobium kwangyangense]